MDMLLFFAEWAFRAQAIIVAFFGVLFVLLFAISAVVEAVQRFKDRKGSGS
ncbi:hypothetical protein [Comamonas sp.]|uniref:hypothetical protein n=1 Tax=Comamonas sp. TaxID=34028 RepID=UPI003A8D6782